MPAPKYSVIADEIVAKIRSGELGPGAKLPSTRQLMEQYKVSETVIRFVMLKLKTLGLVEGEPGKGVFVLPRS